MKLPRLTFLLPLVALATLAPAPAASAVIGGSVSAHGPWAVRMLVDGKGECTGTAISREWIISASHCFFEQAQDIADSRIEFHVGRLDQRRGTVVHPVAGSRRGSPVADMMLIKVPPMAGVTPAKLPATGPVRPGRAVRQYGWGATCTGDENSCQSDVLKQSSLKVLPADDPRCDGFGGGTDFCMISVSGVPAGGDSGGPVMGTGAAADTLIGVFDTSDRERIAGAGEVSGQLGWIRETIAG
ncbi:trypsin-like serine protease [Amycolatopsis sp. PS_44_ISF1]|uniref:S1 family peptidase n=1 Tax=Amycolatopsis sp. PS_44_ISF1 TaxID=2974917 RepID=UPI0028DE4A60|nr:trypsin-like serine protease [Amycolatopsis sp. PS_44_ISF1]MDT8913200.1 trypsin-like serine protease [Amycolatopsis sp. PS_44_ISF1]